MSSSPHLSHLIIGAGVFGTSTALHLKTKYPNRPIALVDRAFPYQASASWDISKVVRADYPHIFYMEKALEAMEIWRSDPLYSPFYHESGLIWVDGAGFSRTVVQNYERLGAREKVRIATPEEVRTLYNGIFASAEIEEGAEILVNERSRWVEASKCLEAVIAAAANEGVRCVEADVSTLEFDSRSSCIGVRSRDGKVITADRVILATGAQTAKLLIDSFPNGAELHNSDRLVAAAICTGLVKLSAEEEEKFEAVPVFLHVVGNSQGEFALSLSVESAYSKLFIGASFPANAENKLKFARDVSFTNTIEHTSGLRISMPPDEPLYAQLDVPQRLKDELATVSQGIFGKEVDNSKLENHRICW
jgi:sarcosine oxidase/L-pipecolate oxidase